MQSYLLSKLFSVAFKDNINLKKNLENIVNKRTLRITRQKEILKKQADNLSEINKLMSEKNEELTSQKQEIELKNKLLDKKNDSVKSSLKYASTIQKTMLPSQAEISTFFKNFIVYKPKDIVSGDFYWFAHIPAKDNFTEKLFIAVVDCTGHGVPGAFMSMIGNRMLNNIINENKMLQPSEILEELNKRIIKSLKQGHSENKDGMDVALCRIEKLENNKVKVTYSGAKSPLFYIKKNPLKIVRLKACPKSIGGDITLDGKFKQYEIMFEKNDMIYLITDGFIDQNNPERRRFGTVKFMKLLKIIYQRPIVEQEKVLNREFDDFREGSPLRDDVTILGLKL